jgi:hypothetical protein
MFPEPPCEQGFACRSVVAPRVGDALPGWLAGNCYGAPQRSQQRNRGLAEAGALRPASVASRSRAREPS